MIRYNIFALFVLPVALMSMSLAATAVYGGGLGCGIPGCVGCTACAAACGPSYVEKTVMVPTTA